MINLLATMFVLAQSIQTGVNYAGGVINTVGTLGGAGLFVFGGLSAWREHNLMGIGGLIMVGGLAAMGLPIAVNMFNAMSSGAVHITPSALQTILLFSVK